MGSIGSPAVCGWRSGRRRWFITVVQVTGHVLYPHVHRLEQTFYALTVGNMKQLLRLIDAELFRDVRNLRGNRTLKGHQLLLECPQLSQLIFQARLVAIGGLQFRGPYYPHHSAVDGLDEHRSYLLELNGEGNIFHPLTVDLVYVKG